MKNCRKMSIGLVLLLAAGLLLSGCAGAKHKPGEVFTCVSDENLDKSISPEAELAEFSCEFKKWEQKDTLHFKVAIKNVSDKEQRYRVNIFLDNGKAVGGLIPRKTNKGLVKPGETASFVYPVGGMEVEPKQVTLMISTIGQ